ncbi:hypothetical protein [Spiroplasma endosymbiont of Ammophila pubescens]|uniref:hypothetical protein n=1 Tax=Spiroplasma endosymbiont of Ammophila pubescens TaxID=3066315 RepID=UPI0032B1D687
MLKEIKQILSVQIKHNLINEDFKEEYLKIFYRKREYYIDTGKGRKYGWEEKEEDFFNNLIGQDTYDINEKRAPKHLFNIIYF